MPTDEILTLEIEPPYIGSAVSPTVDIDETTDDITVTITDFRGEHSYTVEKTDQAITDAEQAAQNANDTAQTVAQGWTNRQNEINVTMNSMRTLMTNSANAESQRVIAENARVDAETERVSAESARVQEWNELTGDVTTAINAANEAASNATNAANRADDASRVANEMISRGNTTITNISNAANQIFAQAGQAIGEANAAATNANAKAGLADTAAQNADTATTAANNAAQTATTAAEQADAAREAIQDDLAAKADKDGYYPLLSAGTSDALLSGDSTAGTFARRTSDHDGACRVESLWGNTVRWNQHGRMMKIGQASIDFFGNAFNNWSISQDGLKASIVNAKVGNFNFYIGNVSSHKVLVKFSLDVSGTFTNRMVIGFGGTAFYLPVLTTGKNSLSAIGTMGTSYSQIYFYPNGTADSQALTCDYEISDYQVFDLTAMFGAGNEPATVEEFEAMFPDAYYPYNAGSLLSVNIEGIESAGVTREIPASTYFPTGIKSAGTAYDELTSDKAVTRIGSVDFGTLEWNYQSTWNSWYTAYRTDVKPSSSDILFANIIHAEYQTISARNAQTGSYEGVGVAITVLSPGNGARILVKNSSNVTRPTGILFFELATPTENAIDPPLNLAYPTEQGGTESIIIPTGEQSAPPTLVTVYAYDADGIVDKSQSIVAPVEGARASTNYAVGSYLVHGGTFYRVTTAIATGETITPGNNVTATTVMAELIRLTA